MAPNICQFLQEQIRLFLSSRDESIRWLGKQCNVDYTTVYRLVEGEQKSLSFINAYKILKFVAPESYVSLLCDFYPNEVKTLELDQGKSSDARIDMYECLASDFNLYKVFCFASTMPNCSRLSIQEEFGREGLALLGKLLEIGALEESDGLFKNKLSGMIFFENDDLKTISIFHHAMILLDRPGSSVRICRANLNEQGIREWYDALEEHQARLEKIAEINSGNFLAVSSAIVGPVSHREGRI